MPIPPKMTAFRIVKSSDTAKETIQFCLLCHFVAFIVSISKRRHLIAFLLLVTHVQCISRHGRICAHCTGDMCCVLRMPFVTCMQSHTLNVKREKRDREKDCVLETPWILETRIGLVRLMNIDELYTRTRRTSPTAPRSFVGQSSSFCLPISPHKPIFPGSQRILRGTFCLSTFTWPLVYRWNCCKYPVMYYKCG